MRKQTYYQTDGMADNEKEFAKHEEFVHKLELNFYFCKPYHFGERRANENTNDKPEFSCICKLNSAKERNAKLLHELVEVKSLNQELMVRINQLKLEIEQLRRDSGLYTKQADAIRKEHLI